MSTAIQTSPAAADAITSIIAGVDHLATEMERKWGCGRLRLLVADEWRIKFDSQRLKWNGAVWSANLPDVELHAARMRAAWAKLDALATEAGHQPLAPEVWEITGSDGRVIAFCRDDVSAHAVAATAAGRHVEVWTPREIAALIERYPVLRVVKQEFPGATVERVHTPLPEGGDELPL
jgi:hypothetical protein